MPGIRMPLENYHLDSLESRRRVSQFRSAVYAEFEKTETRLPPGFQCEAAAPKGNRFPVLSRCSKEPYEKRIREKIPDRLARTRNKIIFLREEI